MNRLTQVSFVIPVRIDSYERGRNLDLLLDYISCYFDSPVYVMEADSRQHYTVKNLSKHIRYHFVEDKNPIFQHTLYLNYLYRMVKTPIIAGWDTDAIVPPGQIVEVVEQIEKGDTVMGLPYNGYMLQTDPVVISLYEKSRDLDVLVHNMPYMYPMYGSVSVGGAFIVNTQEYLRSGGENEFFLGWGPEDFERVKRMEILYPDHILYRSSGFLFHLWHPRYINSRYANLQYEIRGKQEFLKVCGMTTDELRNYISGWPWLNRLQ